MGGGLRVLELYCGIGGCAAALGTAARVVAALDLHRGALALYAHNFPHPTAACNLVALSAAELQRFQADLWWLSPPCQPFTRRGLGRDLDDPRCASLLALVDRLETVRPPYVALENVPGFAGSRMHARLRQALERAGYASLHETLLCPSELGLPNRRRRFYLVAAREHLLPLPSAAPTPEPLTLASCLEPDPDPSLVVEADLLRSYTGALHVVQADDPTAVTNCFTAAYGRSPVRSGSYLDTPQGVRRFSPGEILRLLGFPASYRLPPGLPRDLAWRLVGNSLSLPPVRRLLATIPELARLAEICHSLG